MSKFEESNFYKALQDFFINADKKTFLQFLAEFYNRTEGIIDKNNIQDDLLKELRELYLEFNEKGIDENIVREKVNYFLENSLKIKDINSKLNANTNKIENINSQLDTKANEYYTDVVVLGCDNTGVKDISNILNNYDISKNVLYFPKGIYKIDEVITFKKDVTLIGENAIIKGKAVNCNGIKVTIKGFKFIDSYTSSLSITNCDVVLENNIFENTGLSNELQISYQGCGVYLTNCNVNIKHNEFYKTRGQGSIILNDCNSIEIKYNTFNQPYYRAIELNACKNASGDIAENFIKNCGELLPNGSGVGANGIYGNVACKNVNILNNTIINSVENGIEGTFGIVSGNLIDGTGVDYENKPTPSTEGICVGEGVYVNNTIRNSHKACMKLFTNQKLSNLIITNNNLLSSQNGQAFDINSTVGFENVKIYDNKTDLKAKLVSPNNIVNSYYKGNLKNYEQCLDLQILNTPFYNDFSHFTDAQSWICGSQSFTTVDNLKVVSINENAKITKVITNIPQPIIMKIKTKTKGNMKVNIFKNGGYLSEYRINYLDTFVVEEKYFNFLDIKPTDKILLEIQTISGVGNVNTAQICYISAE